MHPKFSGEKVSFVPCLSGFVGESSIFVGPKLGSFVGDHLSGLGGFTGK